MQGHTIANLSSVPSEHRPGPQHKAQPPDQHVLAARETAAWDRPGRLASAMEDLQMFFLSGFWGSGFCISLAFVFCFLSKARRRP